MSLVQNVIMFGDFNMVTNNELDIISCLPHNIDIVKKWNSLVHDLLLTDIWRKPNKCKKEFTWNCHKPFIARRLDYIFSQKMYYPFV